MPCGALERDPSINFIISDWDMPLMNGLTLLQRIKSDPGKANLPFLIMTSPISQEAEKVMLAAENMVDGYLIKPFRSQALQRKDRENTRCRHPRPAKAGRGRR